MLPEPARFDDGTFDVYYAAKSFETAVAETAYHKSVFFRSTDEGPGWLVQMRELVGAINNRFSDMRSGEEFADYLDPDSYGISQQIARDLRSGGSNGVVFLSVRDGSANALAPFCRTSCGCPCRVGISLIIVMEKGSIL